MRFQYLKLQSTLTDIRGTFCSPGHVLQLLDCLQGNDHSGVQMTDSWVKSMLAVSKTLIEDYDTMPDVVEPLLLAFSLVS